MSATPETTTSVMSGGSTLSSTTTTPTAFDMGSISHPRPSTVAGPRSSRNSFQRQSSNNNSTRRRKRPSTAVTKLSPNKNRQWPKKQQFRSWRQQRQRQLSALRKRPLPPSSPLEERIARETWRDIDVSQLELSPLRSVSSQTILMQNTIQQCLTRLASAPYGKSKDIFTVLAGHTSTCYKRMEQNLAAVAEETTSVEVSQQAMHALSPSTLLQRVWKEAEYYVSSVAERAAATKMKHEQELSQVTRTLQARIAELEHRVQVLTPEHLLDDDGDNHDDENASNRDENNASKDGIQGVVGKYTLDARDRNKRRQYSHTDLKLQKLSSDLMKWHDNEIAKNQSLYTRLELRKRGSARERERIKHGGGHDEDPSVRMTPAARHQSVERFMHTIHHVDEHGRALMLEELFMSFKGHHRIEAMAGMLIQVSSRNRLLLMTDMHNEMKEPDKRRFLEFSLKECGEELAHMLFEKLCEKLPTERRRDLLHEQVDTLGTEQMMKIIQELIAESIGESSRLQLVDGLTSYLSPMEKRECIINIIFGVTIQQPGHGYAVGDMLHLIQNQGNGSLTVTVTGVKDNGKLTGISLVSMGKGYTAGDASCEESGGATFVLTPSSRATQQNILSRLAVVMPKIKQLMEAAGSPPGSPLSGSPRGF